ncbi:MAG: hypothetical protein IPL83_03705 [Bdellovibrionales bacterium]|nr:hypothetical protein [Bdellovibrionales bacterium]
MRVLLDGGPIPIPRPYFAIDTNLTEFNFVFQRRVEAIRGARESEIGQYLRVYGADRMEDALKYVDAFSYDPAQDLSSLPDVGRPESRYSLVKFIEEMENGVIDYPVVYKPNHSGLGNGVIFFEPSAVDQLNITVSKLVDIEDESEWIRFLKKEGFESIGGQDVYSLRVLRRLSRPTLEKLLHKVATSHPIKYDRGMFERMVDPIKFSGKAYETRHMVSGDLVSGRVELVKSDPRDPRVRWFARIGSSRFLSNFGERAEAFELNEPEMYDPLFRRFNFSPDDQRKFKIYVEDIVTREMKYLLERYRHGGFSLDVEVNGAFDFMWLPPAEEGGFPVPILIEADMSIAFPKSRFPNGPPKTIEINIPSPKFSEKF